MINKSIYVPDNAEAKAIMKRVEVLQKMYNCSFSELVMEGLKSLIQSKKTGHKKPDFRTPAVGA